MLRRSEALLAPRASVAVGIAMAAIGSALLVLFRMGLRALNKGDIVIFIALALIQAVLYLLACWLALQGGPTRSTLALIVVFAAILRLSILFAPPYLSSDIYRYIWDGRVQAAGINPYRHVPAAEALAPLRDNEIYPKINRREYAPTIYPPVAQMIFVALTRVSESVVWMKAAMTGFEAITLWALIGLLASSGLPRQFVIVYGWHPLIVWETAGSGHLDAAALAFVTLALLAVRRNHQTVSGVALAAATLVKFFPALLFPALYRRWSWRMPLAFAVTIAVAYLPYLSVGQRVVGFLFGYAREEGLESGDRFFLLLLIKKTLAGASVPAAVYIGLLLSVLVAIAAWSFFRQPGTEQGYITSGLAMVTAFILLLSPRYAWYYAWLVPFLCFRPAAPLLYLTSVSPVLYGLWLGEPLDHFMLLNAVLYVPFTLLCAASLWKRAAQPANQAVIPATKTD